MSSDNSQVPGCNGRYEVAHERRQWIPLALAVLVHAGLAVTFWWGAHGAVGHTDATDKSMSPTVSQDVKTDIVPPVQASREQSTAAIPAVDTPEVSAQVPQAAHRAPTPPAPPEPTVERNLAPKPAPAIKRHASARPQENIRSAVKPSVDKKKLAGKTQGSSKEERTQLTARDKKATNKATVADKKRQQRTYADARQLEQLREAEMRRITSGSVGAGSARLRASPPISRNAAG